MKPQNIQDMQKFSIENLSVLKAKFKMKPSHSFLAYGGELYRRTYEPTYISALYHITPQTIAPGSTRINTVDNIKYFENKVSITSCEEAVSFVRLRTCPVLSWTLDDHLGYEVIIREDVKPDDWLGYHPEVLSKADGYCAVITKADAERMKISSPKCTRAGVFRIFRYLYQSHDRGFIKTEYGRDGNLILFEEEVTTDGKYRVVRKNIHKHNVNSVKWSFPVYC